MDITATVLKPPKIGEAAPPLSSVTLTGKAVSLEKLRGKVVLLDFWATWCEPCVKELPHLKKVYGRFKGQGLVLLGVNVDRDKATLKSFMQEHQVTWPQIFVEKGLQGELPQAYGVRRIPNVILIGVDGKVRGVGLQGAEIEPAVARLFAARSGEEVEK